MSCLKPINSYMLQTNFSHGSRFMPFLKLTIKTMDGIVLAVGKTNKNVY